MSTEEERVQVLLLVRGFSFSLLLPLELTSVFDAASSSNKLLPFPPPSSFPPASIHTQHVTISLSSGCNDPFFPHQRRVRRVERDSVTKREQSGRTYSKLRRTRWSALGRVEPLFTGAFLDLLHLASISASRGQVEEVRSDIGRREERRERQREKFNVGKNRRGTGLA